MAFQSDENGAVTVDWVVLTAGLVGLGLATMAVVSSGVQGVSEDVAAEVGQHDIIATSFSAREHSAFYTAWANHMASEGSLRRTFSYSNDFEQAIAFIESQSDASLITGIQYDGDHIEMRDGLLAVDLASPTAAEDIASVLFAGGGTPTQGDIDSVVEGISDAGGLQEYYDVKLSRENLMAEYAYAMRSIADERGLTY